MNRALTDEERLAERERIKRKDDLDRFNDEMLPDDRRTRHQIRVHRDDRARRQKKIGMPGSLLTTALIFNHFADNVKKAVEALIHLVHHWPEVKDRIAQSAYIKVADTMDPELTVAFAPVSVSPKVAAILKSQIDDVRHAQTAVDHAFAKAQFLGPFIEEKDVHRLKQIFRIRHDHDADCYGHCVTQVEKLEEELGEIGAAKTEMAYIFGVTAAPSASRGYDTKVAEAGAEMTASNIANIEAAQQARPVPPPQFNIV